jgi:O-acetylserine/cysteine efflux transporter
MTPTHAFFALLVAIVWGFNFVVIRVGIDSYPPLMLAAFRFAIAALPVLFLPKPAMSWARIVGIGIFLFLAQFGCLFVAIGIGMPAGLASVVIQSQAIFTIAFSVIFLGERLRPLQIVGAIVSFAGLACIGVNFVQEYKLVQLAGFMLVLAAGLGWAIGNIIVRSGEKTDMLSTVAWTSLIPPIPLLLLSFAFERNTALPALTHFDVLGIASVFYLGFIATTFGYGIWGHLLNLYPAAVVSQFAIAVPIFGLASCAIVFGERFGLLEMAGILLVILGLAFNAFAVPRRERSRMDRSTVFRRKS